MNDLVKRGYREPSMKRKSLRLARQLLQASPMTANGFNAAMNAIHSHPYRVGSWRKLIESAFSRLPKRNQLHTCRFSVLSYFTDLHDYQTARCYVPKRFTGPVAPLELLCAMEIMLALNRLSEAELLVPKCQSMTRSADHPVTRSWLFCSVGDYFAKIGDCQKAFEYYQQAEQEEPCSLFALAGMVKMRVFQAVQEADACLKKLHKLKKDPDNALELMAPGFERDEWDFKVSQLQKYKQAIQTIFPESHSEARTS